MVDSYPTQTGGANPHIYTDNVSLKILENSYSGDVQQAYPSLIPADISKSNIPESKMERLDVAQDCYKTYLEHGNKYCAMEYASEIEKITGNSKGARGFNAILSKTTATISRDDFMSSDDLPAFQGQNNAPRTGLARLPVVGRFFVP